MHYAAVDEDGVDNVEKSKKTDESRRKRVDNYVDNVDNCCV